MYCLANTDYEFYVYGFSTKVKAFIEGNLQTEWNLQFFLTESELLNALKTIKRNENQKIVNLID